LAAWVWMAEMPCAKFDQNQSNRFWDIKIFQFFEMAAMCQLEFVWSIFGQRVVGGFYHCAKFGCDHCSSFDNMKVWILGAFELKTPIYAPEVGFFWQFDPLNGQQYHQHCKRHILARVRIVWATKCENPPTGLTCRWVPKKEGINKKNFVTFHALDQKPIVGRFAPNLVLG